MDDRAWRHRKGENGELESRLFETGAAQALKSGWYDNPDEPMAKKKRKPRAKVETEVE